MIYEQIKTDIQNCKKCPLHESIPTGCNPVCGVGPINAKIMICGEAPGKDEILLDEPFVGLCGNFLTKILLECEINREECYICNTVNCNPRNGNKNRTPTQNEIDCCNEWLWKQINMVNPSIILTLGKIPTCTILGLKKTIKMKDVVGNVYETEGIKSKIIPAYHPSFLLQHGRDKIEDTKNILRLAKRLSYET